MSLFSTRQQLADLHRILFACLRLPFSSGAVPGAVLEEVLAHVHSGEVLHTYDFVDVISHEEGCGWQVKSTRAGTPVTWKRAKLPNAQALIDASFDSRRACQQLGDAIIGLCNEHARASLMKYDLEEIGYARLVLHKSGEVTYFEKSLCSRARPTVFNPEDFRWRWSEPKTSTTKEQLPALHGTNRRSNQRWWAWHGRGENQLHFTGESAWWPAAKRWPFSFQMPSADQQFTIDDLLMMLERDDSQR